jgi:predicted nucleic acid-binding protein
MTLRLCLDLNVLVANLLARAKGRQGTACQALVEAVRRGRCAAGPVQLVISWGMLDRLEDVLRQQLGIARGTAQRYRASLAALAVAGPSGLPPSLTLGGTGVVPLHDLEDRHVLETALAGRADWLVTANLADFIAPGDDIGGAACPAARAAAGASVPGGGMAAPALAVADGRLSRRPFLGDASAGRKAQAPDDLRLRSAFNGLSGGLWDSEDAAVIGRIGERTLPRA